jgi:molybdopterin-synthase adenylyltransferase
MTELELRIPLGVGEALRDIVFRDGQHEYVPIGLASHARLGDRDTLFLRHLLELPESAYRPRAAHGAAGSGSAMIPAIETAIQETLGIVIFHAHGHRGPPQLSDDDRRSAERLIPMFRARVLTRPHGSVVLSRSHAGGIVMMPGESAPRTDIDVRWLGASIIDWRISPPGRSGCAAVENFARQLAIVRQDGQRTLAHARVAVVGLGGGGSHVVQQLAHLGVGDIIGIDADRVAKTNRHRLIGITRLDLWLRRRKTTIMRRVVKTVGLSNRCRTIEVRVPGPAALEILKTADVIVGCLDNLHARADLQELSWRFLIPYVDVGVNIRAIKDPEPEGPRVTIGGNVLTLIPGGFCMWCSAFLSKEKLDAELNGPNRNYFENQGGEAQVVSLNGLVASQAATEVLQLLTGFGGSGLRRRDVALGEQSGLQRGFRKLNGVRGTLDDWGATRRSDCAAATRRSAPELSLGARRMGRIDRFLGEVWVKRRG